MLIASSRHGNLLEGPCYSSDLHEAYPSMFVAEMPVGMSCSDDAGCMAGIDFLRPVTKLQSSHPFALRESRFDCKS